MRLNVALPDAIKADCRTPFKASRTSGVRDLNHVRVIVMHDTEGGTAQTIAAYFATKPTSPTSEPGGSAHLVTDDVACYRTLGNEQIPWGAPGVNTDGFHIEQVGFARWSAVVWASHRATLRRAAYKAAYHCHLFGIPPVFLTADLLADRSRRGITTHAEATKAFGGTHTDPGPLWPRWLFMRYLRDYYAELGPPAV